MNHFQRYLVEEFAEDYQEGRISRREALRLITSITGSVVVANTFLAACTPVNAGPGSGTQNPMPTTGNRPDEPSPVPTATPTTLDASATAPASPTATGAAQLPATGQMSGTVSSDDPAVTAAPVQFAGNDGADLQAYLARPSGEGSFPVVLVCHENRGLTPHIENVARRLAKAGYVALAVDLLSRQGGTANMSSNDVPGALGNIAPDQFVEDFYSGWRYLQEQPFAQAERVGMVGFCFGGGVTWRMATKMPELRAAVPFYGPHPPLEDVPGIQAAVLGIYGGLDSRINQGIPAIEEAMQANNKTFEKVIYEGADHAFHNDTSTRYHPKSAQDAWARTLAWFQQYLA
jgi:carboxymethylenebutenolidase